MSAIFYIPAIVPVSVVLISASPHFLFMPLIFCLLSSVMFVPPIIVVQLHYLLRDTAMEWFSNPVS